MSSVRLSGLSKTYPGGFTAVDDLDLDIADGEFFVIVGPSGCGKSTVLRIVAGLEPPDAGDVVIDGERVNDQTPQERDIAMTSQDYTVYPHMTVAENISFPLRLGRVDVAELERRVGHVARLLDLDAVVDRYPARLSGGQRQRVALGRSIIREPRLLLMDEPMSHLDSRLRVESRAEIMKLHQRLGTTTLLVTHDQVEAMAMADRVALMRDGHVVQCGPPSELYARPLDLFVAQFMGSPPMCTLRASVVSRRGGVAILIGEHEIPLGSRVLATVPALIELDGRDVVVGIRPEAVHRDDAGELVTSVQFTELLGPHRLVYATIHARSVVDVDGDVTAVPERTSTIRTYVDAHEPVSLWEPLRLRVDTDQLYFFDLDTGAAIGR